MTEGETTGIYKCESDVEWLEKAQGVANCEPTCVMTMVHIGIMKRVLRATLRVGVKFGHDFLTFVVFGATARAVEDETIGILDFGCDGGW